MKNIVYLFAIIILAGGAGCTKVLEKKDLSAYDDSKVWSDSTLAREYIDYVYDQNLPQNPVSLSSSDFRYNGNIQSCTEELYVKLCSFALGTLLTSDVTEFGTSLTATNTWYKIRQINQFLDNIDGGSGISRSWRQTLKGQAFFFRALRYWGLVNLYGGVPLILHAQDAVGGASTADTVLYPKRNSTTQCITQICADLDSAVSMLPGIWSSYSTDYGRITKGAALALKGRILLTYASPLFNPNDLTSRWQAAYDANKMAKDTLDQYGFKLNSSYRTMFFKEVSSATSFPTEAVFVTCYNTIASSSSTSKNNSWDLACMPSDWGGSGSNCPTWNIVKAYPMVDGKAPGSSSTYIYADSVYFRNRDPRFYASIGYNGAWWCIGGASKRLWTYTSAESSSSSTGFYCRKMSDTTLSSTSYSGTNWMEIRYAEVLLNLAESACGISRLGTDQEAFTGLIAVRARAGILKGDGYYGLDQATLASSRESMFKAILDERQIEFAFEGKRYQDLRRWKLYDNTANRLNGYKFNGSYRQKIAEAFNTSNSYKYTLAVFKANANDEQSKLDMSKNYSKFFKTLTTSNLESTSISWRSEYYFLPIPDGAISCDPNLQQNADWNGTFDPLQ